MILASHCYLSPLLQSCRFSSAISACEKCGQWRTALDLLDRMKKERVGQTAIAYNAAISACEKGLVPNKAVEIFEQMKREGIKPTVVTYSALISAAEKGQQWRLALQVLDEMKAEGHGANVVAYSAAISALSKGQQWELALKLFREIEASGGTPSIVTFNATMTALEKGLQWSRALDLFDEMKSRSLPITVVSYGSAISACDKGLQYRQCLEYLDEMTEMGIGKNVIIFGAAMSCMEKCCRADIAFQLMERMKLEGVSPNVHIYNSAISACARCNLWERGYELFLEMDEAGVARDVVTYNAVLDAVSSQIGLGRKLFQEGMKKGVRMRACKFFVVAVLLTLSKLYHRLLCTGVEKGFYARVSRLGSQWLELDLHFLSLGGGEIALGWWFEECLVPFLVDTKKLEAVQSISIVTGYGKTRLRGARQGDDGMRKRVRAMLNFMKIEETPQPNRGRVHIDKEKLIAEVKRNGGRVVFDLEGYMRFKEEETTANKFPSAEQKVRPRYKPVDPHRGGPPFIRIETESTSPEFRLDPSVEMVEPPPQEPFDDADRAVEKYPPDRDSGRYERDSRDRGGRGGDRNGNDYSYDRRNGRSDDRYEGGGRGGYDSRSRRGSYDDRRGRGGRRGSFDDRRGGGGGGRYDDDRRGGYDDRRYDSRRREDDGRGGRDYEDRRYASRDQVRGPSNWEPPAHVNAAKAQNGYGENNSRARQESEPRYDGPPRVKEEQSPAEKADGEGIAKKRNSYSGRGYSLDPSATKRPRTSEAAGRS